MSGMAARWFMVAVAASMLWTSHPAAAAPTPAVGTPHRVEFNHAFYPQERASFLVPELRQSFPELGVDFEVLAPATREYNCIAWSLGIITEWVSPITGPPQARLAGMDQLYEQQGYRRLPVLDYRHEPGVVKVAVYANRYADGSISEVTHAAIQLPDGTWTSKCGSMALIRHRTPESVTGPAYGDVVAIYARPAQLDLASVPSGLPRL